MLSLFAAAAIAASPAALPAALPLSLAALSEPSTSRNDPDRVICRQRPVTGSRTRFTRTCMTQREWDTQRQAIARGMSDHVTREMASQPPPPITPGSD